MGLFDKLFGKQESRQRPNLTNRDPAVMNARCIHTGNDFEIVLDFSEGYALMKEARAVCGTLPKQGGKNGNRVDVSQGLYVSDNYACPYCGWKSIVLCYNCQGITCHDGSRRFQCAHCQRHGKLSGTIQELDTNATTTQ